MTNLALIIVIRLASRCLTLWVRHILAAVRIFPTCPAICPLRVIGAAKHAAAGGGLRYASSPGHQAPISPRCIWGILKEGGLWLSHMRLLLLLLSNILIIVVELWLSLGRRRHIRVARTSSIRRARCPIIHHMLFKLKIFIILI